jgi:hypothetical protein
MSGLPPSNCAEDWRIERARRSLSTAAVPPPVWKVIRLENEDEQIEPVSEGARVQYRPEDFG